MFKFLINLYLFATILYAAFNLSAYQYLLNIQKKQFLLTLKNYNILLENILINDLQKILKGEGNNFLPFFRRQTVVENKKKDKDKDRNSVPKPGGNPLRIYVGSHVGIVDILNSGWIIDLFELRKTLDKAIPHYITYNISINQEVVATSKITSQTAVLKQIYNLGDNDSALIILGIDPNSSYFKETERKTKFYMLFLLVGSLVIFSFTLLLYIKVAWKTNQNIKLLENSLGEEERKNKVFLLKTECEQQLRNLFIKKATEIYLTKELGIDNIDTTTLEGNERNPSQYLFPIALTDKSLSRIDIEELIDILRNYFADKFISIAIEFKTEIEELNIKCAKEVFYQLIFSLLYNLIRFMESQSDQIKLISVNLKPESVIITYDSFMINEDAMIMLSWQILADVGDIFLLSCDKIFSSLKNHDLDYQLYYKDGVNIVEINLSKAIHHTLGENKVIQLNPKRTRK